MRKLMLLAVFLVLAMTAAAQTSTAQAPPPASPSMVVGRVYDVEDGLLRYVPDENDWVAVVRDAPFGAGDALYSGSRGKAEMIVPNGTWIRIGSATQIQFVALDNDVTEADVAAGTARFYNKGGRTAVKATCPFGYVLAYPGAAFDFYVGENSAEVVALEGSVSFVLSATNARYDISAGSPSILADGRQVASGAGAPDEAWDAWNVARDNFWATKFAARGPSYQYLPPALRDDAYSLDENGQWEPVSYEGSERWLWRPTTVPAGWAPFTAGRWTEWYGDQTWIPAEPFGYVTHHYGSWVLVGNSWYWAPPVVGAHPGRPLLNMAFAWSPGRVSWIYNDGYVGWVPLAPSEVYYSHHHWGGPRTEVITGRNIDRINVNVRNYAYAGHAVVVTQNNFYGVNNYRSVRVTSINPATIINSYHAAPVVNNTVIANYTTIRQRYNYANVPVSEKPHVSVVEHIRQNEKIAAQGRGVSAASVEQQAKAASAGRVNNEARVPPPKMTNYVVPAGQANRPKSEVQMQQREVKGASRGPQVQPGATPRAGAQPPQSFEARPAQPGPRPRPAAEPQARPPQGMQPGQGPTGMGQQVRPVAPPRTPAAPMQAAPAQPAQFGQPGQRPQAQAQGAPRPEPPRPAQAVLPTRSEPPRPVQAAPPPRQEAPRPAQAAPPPRLAQPPQGAQPKGPPPAPKKPPQGEHKEQEKPRQ